MPDGGKPNLHAPSNITGGNCSGKWVWPFLQKLSGIPVGPRNSAPRYIHKGNGNTDPRKHLHVNIHSSLFITGQEAEQPKHPLTKEWMINIRCAHTVEYYSVMKKNAVLNQATAWTSLENIMLGVSGWLRCCSVQLLISGSLSFSPTLGLCRNDLNINSLKKKKSYAK